MMMMKMTKSAAESSSFIHQSGNAMSRLVGQGTTTTRSWSSTTSSSSPNGNRLRQWILLVLGITVGMTMNQVYHSYNVINNSSTTTTPRKTSSTLTTTSTTQRDPLPVTVSNHHHNSNSNNSNSNSNNTTNNNYDGTNNNNVENVNPTNNNNFNHDLLHSGRLDLTNAIALVEDTDKYGNDDDKDLSSAAAAATATAVEEEQEEATATEEEMKEQQATKHVIPDDGAAADDRHHYHDSEGGAHPPSNQDDDDDEEEDEDGYSPTTFAKKYRGKLLLSATMTTRRRKKKKKRPAVHDRTSETLVVDSIHQERHGENESDQVEQPETQHHDHHSGHDKGEKEEAQEEPNKLEDSIEHKRRHGENESNQYKQLESENNHHGSGHDKEEEKEEDAQEEPNKLATHHHHDSSSSLSSPQFSSRANDYLNGDEIVGDVSGLLDFAILGFSKTATSYLVDWLRQQTESIAISNKEVCFLNKKQGSKLIHYLVDTLMEEAGDGDDDKLRGFKCPSHFTRPSLEWYRTYFFRTKLIVGLRHPVSWFESFYNFRIRHSKYPNESNITLPPPDRLIGKCHKASQGLCTYNAEFHRQLARLAKTPLNRTERTLLHLDPSDVRGLGTRRVNNPVFVYEITQLQSDQTRFGTSLAHFLGLSKPLSPYRDEHSSSSSSKKKKKKAIDICESQYTAVRTELMKVSREASDWILNYFIDSPTVTTMDDLTTTTYPTTTTTTTAKKNSFVQAIQNWKKDPCDNRNDDNNETTNEEEEEEGEEKE